MYMGGAPSMGGVVLLGLHGRHELLAASESRASFTTVAATPTCRHTDNLI